MFQKMFRKILVPLDFTERNQSAVDAVLLLASPGEASVVLFHVIELLPHIPFDELEPFYKRLEETARENLEGFARRFESNGQRVALEIVYGKRAEEIVRYASSEKIDLIVLSSHRPGAQGADESLGTISHQVGILAPCSVLLLK